MNIIILIYLKEYQRYLSYVKNIYNVMKYFGNLAISIHVKLNLRLVLLRNTTYYLELRFFPLLKILVPGVQLCIIIRLILYNYHLSSNCPKNVLLFGREMWMKYLKRISQSLRTLTLP